MSGRGSAGRSKHVRHEADGKRRVNCGAVVVGIKGNNAIKKESPKVEIVD
jgi:hypothetical protein